MELKDIISTESFAELLTIMIQAIIVIFAFVLKKYGMPILKKFEASLEAKLGESTFFNVKAFAWEMVNFVESKYSTSFEKMGKTKRQEVLVYIKKLYPDFSDELLEAIIQNTVTEMNAQKNILITDVGEPKPKG